LSTDLTKLHKRVKSVHPLANLFPMMDKHELIALADDIRENGLREPIDITKDGELRDGRNRLVASVEAGVEPEFNVVDGDAADAIVSANVVRRHLTQGQIAIMAVVAELGIDLANPRSPDAADPRGPVDYAWRKRLHDRVEQVVSENMIKGAVKIVRYAPDHAKIVLDSGKGWREARETAEERSRQAHSEETRIEILREHDSDLLEQVEDGGLSVSEAWRVYEGRIREERETRVRLTGYLVDRITPLLGKSDPAELVTQYDPELASRQIGVAELSEAIEYLRAILSEYKRQKKG
jgi:hypothetical protein